MSLTGRMDEDAVVRRRQQWRVQHLQGGRDTREGHHVRAGARPGAGRALDAAGRRSSAAGNSESDDAVAGEAEGVRWLQGLLCAVSVMLCRRDFGWQLESLAAVGQAAGGIGAAYALCRWSAMLRKPGPPVGSSGVSGEQAAGAGAYAAALCLAASRMFTAAALRHWWARTTCCQASLVVKLVRGHRALNPFAPCAGADGSTARTREMALEDLRRFRETMQARAQARRERLAAASAGGRGAGGPGSGGPATQDLYGYLRGAPPQGEAAEQTSGQARLCHSGWGTMAWAVPCGAPRLVR